MGRRALNKKCGICQVEKPVSEFYKHSRYSKKRPWFRGNCKSCHSKLGKEAYKNNKLWYDTRLRAEHLQRTYSMTVEEWDALHEKQRGLCAACGKPEIKFNNKSKKIQRLCVDHCHKTGKIRGLLCNRCNRIIGLAEEDLNILELIYKYVKDAS